MVTHVIYDCDHIRRLNGVTVILKRRWNNKQKKYVHCPHQSQTIQGLYSLSGRTSYRKISWSLEAARFGFIIFQSFWNLTSTSAVLLPMCPLNFKSIRSLYHPNLWLRNSQRFGGKTSYRLVNRSPGWRTDDLLGPSEAIWRQRSGSTLAQVMACCLTAPSHYLN